MSNNIVITNQVCTIEYPNRDSNECIYTIIFKLKKNISNSKFYI